MVKIISDSTCDLSQEVLERYDIDIIPLHIVKGDEELEDGPQIDIHALYEWADKNKTTPKTSAPSIETAIETCSSRRRNNFFLSNKNPFVTTDKLNLSSFIAFIFSATYSKTSKFNNGSPP